MLDLQTLVEIRKLISDRYADFIKNDISDYGPPEIIDQIGEIIHEINKKNET